MKKSNKKFKIILGLVIFVFTVSITGVVLILAFKNSSSTSNYKKAVELYNKNEFQEAKKFFERSVMADPNDEKSWVKLAEISEMERNWIVAQKCWQVAYKLNALNKDYLKNTFYATLNSRQYDKIILRLAVFETLEVANLNSILAFSYFASNQADKAKELLAKIADSEHDELALFTQFLLDSTPDDYETDEYYQALLKYAQSQDSIVALESNVLLLRYYYDVKDFAKAEESIATLAQMNPAATATDTVNYYFATGDFEKGKNFFDQALPYGVSSNVILNYIDNLFYTNNMSELNAFYKKLENGSKKDLEYSFYIQALQEYYNGEYDKLSNTMVMVDDLFDTPLSEIVKLELALEQENVDSVVKILQDLYIKEMVPAYLAKRYDAIQSLLEKNYAAGKRSEIVDFAKILEKLNQKNLVTTLIILEDKSKHNILTNQDIIEAEQLYPNEPNIQYIMVTDAFKKGDYKLTIELARKLLEQEDTKAFVAEILLFSLENLGAIEEAQQEYNNYVARFGDSVTLRKNQLLFAMRHNLELPTFANSSLAFLDTFVAGEKARLNQDNANVAKYFLTPELLNNLDKNSLEDYQILYHIAYTLTQLEEYQYSLEVYNRIVDSPYASLEIYLNMFELYKELKQYDLAHKYAQKAYDLASSMEIVRSCYALSLYDIGKTDDALRVMSLLVGKAQDPRILVTWTAIMEDKIKQSYNSKEYIRCTNLCKELLKVAPTNATAIEYRTLAEKNL